MAIFTLFDKLFQSPTPKPPVASRKTWTYFFTCTLFQLGCQNTDSSLSIDIIPVIKKIDSRNDSRLFYWANVSREARKSPSRDFQPPIDLLGLFQQNQRPRLDINLAIGIEIPVKLTFSASFLWGWHLLARRKNNVVSHLSLDKPPWTTI